MPLPTAPERERWPFSNFEDVPGGLFGFDADDPNRYRTLEHAYQAAKTTDQGWRDRIAAARTPGAAKRLGRQVPLRPRWDMVKLTVMQVLLRLKWSREPFRSRLLGTAGPLVEMTTWHDTFWGTCTCPRHNGRGSNHLGRLLGETRTALSIAARERR
jgi:ribA/ribD-fused uncharacterized protein